MKKNRGFKDVVCSTCHKTIVKVDSEAVGAICWICVEKMVGPPKEMKTYSSGRPRGWQFMKVFVDKNLNVFYRGVEQPDLKGTKRLLS